MRMGIGDEYGTLFHYFLGELPEGEREAAEERYVLDETYAELRDEVEMDLVDAYVGGTLTPLERRHFERHYMVTRERREGVKAAFLSRVYRERIARPAARAASAPGLAFLPKRSLIPAMAAALAMLALGGASWLTYESWEIQRQIKGVAKMADSRPERPLRAPHDAGGAQSKLGSSEQNPLESQSVPPRTSVITAAPSEDKDAKGHKQLPAPAPPVAPIEPPSQAVQTPTPAPAPEPTVAAPVPVEPPSQALQPPKDTAVAQQPTYVAQQPTYIYTPPAYAMDPSRKAAIQKKLESEYQLTKTTDDKSDIVTAGSVLILHKDKVLMVAGTSAANPCMNTYKDGKISPTKACGAGEKLRRLPGFSHVPGGGSAPATRNFVSGEKFWVTKIDVKDNGVVLDFFTDSTPAGDQGVRYKGSLTIPFGALTPTPDDALKVVAEVITVAPLEDKDANGEKQQAAPSSAPVPAEVTSAPIELPPTPAEVSLGQTPEQVVARLGEPVKKAKVGSKDIYFYKDMKVTFVNGRVTDIQ